MSKIGAFVVSGSGSGIGLAITRGLITEGHSVFGLGRDKAKLERASSLFPTGKFEFMSADLADADSTLAAVVNIKNWLEKSGLPLLGLVNNAGVFDLSSFLETSDSIWERQFNNNLLSAVRLTRELHSELLAAAPSSVLNISSSVTERVVPNTAAYTALKAALSSWTKSLASEWAPQKIRVNSISPGIVDTPIHDFHGRPDSERGDIHKLQPIGRMGKSDDIAAAALFLLSEKSSWTTGSNMLIDGGITL